MKKFASRKFICCAIVTLVGIITLFIGENETVDILASAAMTIIPAVVYCITEGKIDANSIKQITQATAEAADKFGVDEQIVDVIEKVGNAAESYAKSEEKDTDVITEEKQ